jgi:hypothetical protein
MRRLALSLVAIGGFAALTACSGGYGLNTGGNQTPTSIVFTNGSGQVNDFFVSYQGSAPILVAATAVNGTGATSTVIPDVVFTWAASFAPAGTLYRTGASPNGQAECGTPSQTPTINSLLQQGGKGNPFPFYTGANVYTQLQAQQVLAPNPNPGPTYTQQAAQIFVGPPTVPVPDPVIVGQYDASTTPILPASPSTNYCLNLVATAVPSGVKGGILVVVEP